MSNIVISPQSGVIEFNNNSPSGAAIGSATAPIRLDATGGNSFITGGNLGVGMTAPLSALHVYGDGGTAARIDNGALKIRYPGNNDAITITPSVGNEGRILASDPDTASPHPLKIAGDYVRITTSGNAAATEVARFTADGKVGIGITDPDAFLDVSRDNSNAGNQFVVADTEGTSAAIRTYTHGGDPAGLILNHYYAEAGGGNEYARYADFVSNVGNGAGTKIRFITKNAANNYFATTIDKNGSVGIGSSSPSYKLDVNGTIHGTSGNFETAITINGNPVITGSSASEGDTLQTVTDRGATTTNSIHLDSDSAQLQFGDANNMQISHNSAKGEINVAAGDFEIDSAGDIILDADGGDILIKDGGTQIGQISKDISSSNFVIKSSVSDADLEFKGVDGGANITAMTIDMSAGGNVGIGTSSPDGILNTSGGHVLFQGLNKGYVRVRTQRANTSDYANVSSSILTLNNYYATQEYGLYATNSNNFRIQQSGNDGYLELDTNDFTLSGIRLVCDIANQAPTNLAINLRDENADEVGFYSPATNEIGFVTDRTERMRIDNNGKIGIGTTSPADTLQVAGQVRIDGSTTDGLTVTSNAGASQGLLIYNNSNTDTASIINYYDGPLVLGQNNTEVMRLHSNGNVGIGSNSPTDTLTINQTADSNGIRINGYDDHSSSFAKLFVKSNGHTELSQSTNGADGYLKLSAENYLQLAAGTFVYTDDQFRIYDAGQLSLGNGADFFFKYDNSTDKLKIHSSTNDGITMDTAGNVGIGTNNPTGTLHVYNTNTTSDGDGTATMNATGQDSIVLYGHGGVDEATYGGISWMGGSTRRRAMITAVAENTDQDHLGLAFYTQGTDGPGDFSESMRITRDGDVGIGTTSVNAGIGLQVANGSLYVTNGIGYIKHLEAQYFGNGTELKLSAGQSADLKLMHYNTVDVTVKSDGKVGIGTTGPSGVLDVGGDGADIFLHSNDYKIARIQPRGTSADLDKGLFSLFSTTTETVRIDSAGSSWFNGGSVGIGTDNPQSYLDVKTQIRVRDSNSDSTHVLLDSNASEGRLRLNNGSNWGLIARGQANNPYLGAYEGGSLNIVGFSTSDGANIDHTLTQFDFGNQRVEIDQYTVGSNGSQSVYGKLSSFANSNTDNIFLGLKNGSYPNRGFAFRTVADGVNCDFTIYEHGLGSAEVFRITSEGYVGIGTDNPVYALTIGGNAIGSTGGLRINDPSNAAYGAHFSFADTPNEVHIGGITNNVYNDAIGIYRESTRTITIDSSQRVGIGTTSPSQLLDVNGDAAFAQYLYHQGDEDTNIKFVNDDFMINVGGATFFRATETTQNTIKLNSDNEDTDFYLYGNNGTPALFMRGSDREIGINTTNPTASLHVVGNASINGASSDGVLTINNAAGSQSLRIDQNSIRTTTDNNLTLFSNGTSSQLVLENGGNVGIGTNNPAYQLDVINSDGGTLARFKDSDSSHAGLIIQGDTNGGSITNASAFTSEVIYLQNSANAMRFYTDGTEAVRIDSSQRVGIGTNSVNGFTHINGRMLVESPTVPSTLAISDSGDATKNLRLGYEPTWDVGSISASDFGAGWKDIVIAPIAGKVGIGTTAPHQALSVKGTIVSYNSSYVQVAGITNSSDAGRLYANNAGGVTNVLLDSNGDSYLKGGDVGIGTATPDAKLDVEGSMQVKGDASWAGTDSQAGAIFMDTDGRGLLGAFSTNYARPLITANSNYIDLGSAGTSLINGFRFYAGSASSSVGTYDFYTSGSNNRLHIAKDGSVGIGSASPVQKLDVAGVIRSSVTSRIQADTYNNSANSANIIYRSSSKTIVGNNASALVIEDGGDVGIGTTNPVTKLEVQDSAGAPMLQLRPNAASTDLNPIILYRSQLDGSANYMLCEGTSTYFGTYHGGVPSDKSEMIRILPNSSDSPSLRIGDAGSTAANLQVGGNIKLLNNGASYINGGDVGIGTATPAQKLHLEFSNTDTSFAGGGGGSWGSEGLLIENTSSTADTMSIIQLRNGDADIHIAGIRQGTNDGDLGFFFEGSEKVRFTKDGSVGIGSNTPQGLLDVEADTDQNVFLGRARFGSHVTDYLYLSHYDNATSTSYALKQSPAGSTAINAKAGMNVSMNVNNSAVVFVKGSNSNVGIGTDNPANKLDVGGGVAIGASYVGNSAPSNGAIIQGNVGIGTTSASYALQVNGSIVGSYKSFLIDHPTKEGKQLMHSCIEGPEHAVYFRGKSNLNVIKMPDYWEGLVDLDTMTVELTAIGANQNIYVDSIAENGEVTVGSNTDEPLNYFYVVYGERKDIDKLETEIIKPQYAD